MIRMLGQIRKATAALIGAVILWFDVVIAAHNGGFPVGDITAYEWLGLAIAVFTALGVYGISNATPAMGKHSPGYQAPGDESA